MDLFTRRETDTEVLLDIRNPFRQAVLRDQAEGEYDDPAHGCFLLLADVGVNPDRDG